MTEQLLQIDSLRPVADSVSCPLRDSVAECVDSMLCADSVFVGGERLVDVPRLFVPTLLDVQLLAPVVQILMLAVVLIYMWVVYRRSSQVLEMASWTVYSSLSPIVEAHTERRSTLPWRLFGLFSLGSVAVMAVCKYLLTELDVEPYWVVGATIVCVAFVWLLQSFLVWIIGKVVLQGEFFGAVSALRNYAVELAGIFMTPFVVAYAFGGDATSSAVWIILLILTIIVITLFTLKLLNLFIGARFSILYLFLYLCAVEIFPMSLAVAVTLRLL